jgi:hypothetical protein
LQRLLTTATIAGLLIATAAAFAITERLKLTKSAVYGTHVSTRLSPTCGCARGKATIFFKLRRRDHITVTVVNARKDEVALLSDVTAPAGPVRLRWDGGTDADTRAPDGVYYARIHLAAQHQTITLPNPMLLDTKPPLVLSVKANRVQFSPDRDRQADYVRLTYRLSKPAHLLLFLDGKRILGPTHSHGADGSVSWHGNAHGATLPAGFYTLEIGALDQAGNSTPVAARVGVTVEIRYIALAAHRIVVHAGSRFEIGVSTDAKSYAWKLGAHKGRAAGPVLRLRAPRQRGLYTLLVEERGHLDRARVIVR